MDQAEVQIAQEDSHYLLVDVMDKGLGLKVVKDQFVNGVVDVSIFPMLQDTNLLASLRQMLIEFLQN